MICGRGTPSTSTRRSGSGRKNWDDRPPAYDRPVGDGSSEQLDVWEAAHRCADGRGTVRELRSALYRDLRGPCDGPLTGGWADLFNAFERWEDTLHVDAAKQASIEDEIRAIAASLTAGRP